MYKLSFFIIFLLFFRVILAQYLYQSGKIFIKFKTSTTLQNIDYTKNTFTLSNKKYNIEHVFHKYKVKSVKKTSKLKAPSLQNIYTITFEDTASTDLFINELIKFLNIEYAERAPLDVANFTPNDLHPNQWNLLKIQAPQAWDLSTGTSSVVVAIVDDAVLTTHEDLQASIWVNTGEIANNSLDDDNNGYVDDVNGYDLADNDNNPNPPAGANNFSHGTHCAGIAAATSHNGRGIASPGYSVKILPVKTKYSSTSDPYLHATYEGVEYAIAAGADVISMSYGSSRYSLTYQTLFNYAHSQGIVLVAAAGNNNSSSPFYPASYNHVISVGSTGQNDVKSTFSNYGNNIDIMAPGSGIWSTLAMSNSYYGYYSGTSMACPLVAGAAALLLSKNPILKPDEIEACIKSGADNINTLNPTYIGMLGAGRLNLYNSILCASYSNHANFAANPAKVCINQVLTITDMSVGTITGYVWSLPGGTPSYSTLKNPIVSYPFTGKYDVYQTVTGVQNTTHAKMQYIDVYTPSATISGNATINAGQTAFIRLDFSGVAPYAYTISGNGNLYMGNNINSNPYYLAMSPITTTSYFFTQVKDNNCNGNIFGASNINVTTTLSTTLGDNITAGLLGHWPFNGNPNDVTSNNNHALPNGAVLTTDRFGNNNSAYYFDGVNDYMTLTKPLVGSNFTNKITISVWIYVMGNGNNWPRIVIGGRVNETFTFTLKSNASNIIDGILWRPKGVGAGGTDLVSNTVLTTNTWYHLVAWYDGSKAKIYINGVNNVEINASGNIPLESTFQGGAFGGETLAHEGGFLPSWLHGKLDDIRIYNRALSDCEILSIYNGNNSCNTNNLVAHYPFCGNANDVSGNSLHANVVNATLASDKSGNMSAYTFNGTNAYIVTPNSTILGVKNSGSIAIWAKRTNWTSLPPVDHQFINNNLTAPSTCIHLSFHYSFGLHFRYSCGGTTYVSSNIHQTWADNSWHHIVAKWEPSSVAGSTLISLYADGQFQDSKILDIVITSSSTTWNIGKYIALTHQEWLNGVIDDVKIYSRALSASDITALYNESDHCKTGTLVAHYPFCGNANDVSGNNYHGTVSGATYITNRFNTPLSAISLSGTGTMVTTLPGVSGSGARSISLWIKPDAQKTSQSFLFWYGRGGADAIGNPAYYNQQFTARINYGPNSDMAIDINSAAISKKNSSTNLYDGNWHHLVYVVNNVPNASLNDTKFYVDNVLQSTIVTNVSASNVINTQIPPTSSAFAFRLGYTLSSNLYNYQGAIDDVRFYDYELNSNEISTLYNESDHCQTGTLVAHYPFCGNANDVSGNSLHADVVNATLTSDKNGNNMSAYTFNGTNAYISTPFSSLLGVNYQGTLALWVKRANWTSLPSVDNEFINNNVSYPNSFCIYLSFHHVEGLHFRYSLGGFDYISSNIYQSWGPNSWHHIVAKWEPSSAPASTFISLYADGQYLSGKVITQAINYNNYIYSSWHIGKYLTPTHQEWLNGAIDDVRIYNYALSASAISTLYSQYYTCCTTGNFSLAGANTVCLGQTANYILTNSTLSGVSYTVSGGSIITQSNQSIQIKWTLPGNNLILARETVCGLSASMNVNVTCCPSAASSISGASSACLKDYEYYYEIDNPLPVLYTWTVTGGIFRQLASGFIAVTWTNAGNNLITAKNTLCNITLLKIVNVSCCGTSTISVSGPNSVCLNTYNVYNPSDISLSDNFSWTVTGASYTLVNAYTLSILATNLSPYQIHVRENKCGAYAQTSVNVTDCNNSIVLSISGPNTFPVCYNNSYFYTINNTNGLYAWTVAGGKIITYQNQQIIVGFTTLSPIVIYVKDLNTNNIYTKTISGICCPNESKAIAGNNSSCYQNSGSYSVSPVYELEKYNFSLSGGYFDMLDKNILQVVWTSTGTHLLQATETTCGINIAKSIQINCCNMIAGNNRIKGEKLVCNNKTYEYQILNPLSNVLYEWDSNDAKIISNTPNTATLSWTGANYMAATAKSGNSLCADMVQIDSVKYVAENITANLGPDIQVYCANSVLNVPTGTQGKIHWSTGDTTAQITLSKSGSYIVTITGKCTFATDSVIYTKIEIPEKIPNIITPNNDDMNEKFIIEGCIAQNTSVELTIFSRWGTIVYEDKKYTGNWDANSVQDGVYFYHIFNPNLNLERRGWVVIQR
ncbi:MAG: LamG-like jellyroll fold domain-containing protein [Cytophagales bacterium]|nr:LamG-like jellyroll fold domain-containing protein [Cytophagales bacterium]